MLIAQDAIAIPLIYLETFVMTFVAFCIGYFGSSMYARSKAKSMNRQHTNELLILKNTIANLKADLDRKSNSIFKKDRMDQELEQVNLDQKSESDPALEEEIKALGALGASEINFDRIGQSSAAERDNLEKITGIGPYTASKLNALGIYTFEQISNFNEEDIKTITRLIKFFPDRIKNDRWVAKAKLLITSSGSNKNGGDTRLKKI